MTRTVQQSADVIVGAYKGTEGPNMKTKERSRTSMTTDNCRKEAKMGEAEVSSLPISNSAMVDEAERKQSILPRREHQIYNPTISGVVDRDNIQEALKAVKRNKGAPGIDGITTEEIHEVMEAQWPKIKQEILDGKYLPKPVRRVEIPKPDGTGVRQLGIPTVMDRIIQQAVYQEIYLAFDPLFSPYSYGFRPHRSAHQAVLQAQEYIQEGCKWVVDIDLEKFFDKVNHDMLMARVARKVKDKKILLLIRRFLQAGVMDEGLVKPTEEGTPQGGPLSPLLSNIMLDDLDRELEDRGLRFVRYADDCNIYVKSEKAAQRVMTSVVKYVTEKLKLKVNERKSAVDNPWNRKFLGFTFAEDQEPNIIRVHDSRVKRFKDKIREVTGKMRGGKLTENIRKRLIPITRGWINYFGIASDEKLFKAMDSWIRRRLRCILWRQWKRPRAIYKRLVAGGVSREQARRCANARKGPWRMAASLVAHKILGNKVMEEKYGYTPMTTMASARS